MTFMSYFFWCTHLLGILARVKSKCMACGIPLRLIYILRISLLFLLCKGIAAKTVAISFAIK